MNHPSAILAIGDFSFLGGNGSIPASKACAIISNSSSIVWGGSTWLCKLDVYSNLLIGSLKSYIPSSGHG